MEATKKDLNNYIRVMEIINIFGDIKILLSIRAQNRVTCQICYFHSFSAKKLYWRWHLY